MKVTTKGQVAIPVRIREYLGIAPHSDVDFRIGGGAVVLLKNEEPCGAAGRFAPLCGVLKNKLRTQ
jgi:AbrB family looped-hinge helix DNA binding protein